MEGTQIITLTSTHVISPNSSRSWWGRYNPKHLTSSTHSKLKWPIAEDYGNIVIKNSYRIYTYFALVI